MAVMSAALFWLAACAQDPLVTAPAERPRVALPPVMLPVRAEPSPALAASAPTAQPLAAPRSPAPVLATPKAAEAARVPESRASDPAAQLLGTRYRRAFVVPRVIGRKWTVVQRITARDAEDPDVLLLANGATRAAALALRTRRLQGVSHEFQISAVLMGPPVQAIEQLVLCRSGGAQEWLGGSLKSAPFAPLWLARMSPEGLLELSSAPLPEGLSCRQRR